MKKLVAFIATADPARARAFYERTLGLVCVDDGEFALVFDCDGTQLRVQKVDHVEPHAYTSLGWQVSDLPRTMQQLTRAGVTFERYPFLDQDAYGVWLSPSGTRVAWFKDPDGNLLSLQSEGE